MKQIITVIIFLFFSSNLFSQFNTNGYDFHTLPNNRVPQDIEFVNSKIGWVVLGNYYSTGQPVIYKTTNRGQNWFLVASDFNLFNDGYVIGKVFINFVDENTGWFSFGYQYQSSIEYPIYKTTNGGVNWQNVFTYINDDSRNGWLKFVNANTGYMYNLKGGKICKTTDGGMDWNVVYQIDNDNNKLITDLKVSPFDNNIIYASGGKTIQYYDGYPILVKTTNGFNSQNTTIYDGTSQPGNGIGIISSTDLIIYNNADFVRFGSKTGIYKLDGTNVNLFCSLPSYSFQPQIIFKNYQEGYKLDGGEIVHTTNSGSSWNIEFEPVIEHGGPTRMSGFGDAMHFMCAFHDENGGNLETDIATRGIKPHILTNYDNISSTGNLSLDGSNFNTPFYNYFYGGLYNIVTPFVLNENTENERLFLKWENNNRYPIYPNARTVDIINDEMTISADYKSKFKSNVSTAIGNSPQTKAVRDTSWSALPNGIIHEIHESMGGIFYSRSSNGGTTFSKEEVLTYFGTNNDIYDGNGNKNSFLAVKRCGSGTYPLTTLDQEKDVAVVWERYNQSTQKTEIMISERVNNIYNTGYEWSRFLDQTNTPVFCSFNSSSEFNSFPKLFIASPLNGNLSNSVIIVPHLEPTTGNSTKLVITVDYHYSVNNQTYYYHHDYTVDDGSTGNISNLAVASPFNNYNIFGLHIAYQKDNSINNIVYRKINVGRDAFLGPFYQEETSEYNANVGTGDGNSARFWPDISVQNGLPVITYRGNYYEQRIISIGSEEDNVQTISLQHHPINVKYKKPNGTWSSFLTYDGLSQQDNPNIEGSKNATGYLLTFKKNGSHYQFVKIDGLSGYSCSPGVFQGEDAKLVRGSYIGQFSTNYNPMILTLSNLVNSTYTVGKQSFSITNSQNQNQTDGFSNLNGNIMLNGTSYSLTLGPIIACNAIASTSFGFDDQTPPEIVHNTVEFNETMTSNVFSLSNNDTLILGANGKYLVEETSTFTPLIYHVNLVNNNSGNILRELFRDTVTLSDSVGIDFLRGFIITDIEKGTDEFYVQMVLDTANTGDADYTMAGVYGDNSLNACGDNPTVLKTKIFFEKRGNTNHNLNIPKEYSVSQNYPNPFNPVTNIKFQIPKDGFVTLIVYDITGREIAKLVNEVKQAGNYTVAFNGGNFASGVYFYKIQSGDFIKVKKMVLVK